MATDYGQNSKQWSLGREKDATLFSVLIENSFSFGGKLEI